MSLPEPGGSTPTGSNTYTCYHCAEECGGGTPGGYAAITDGNGAIRAACSPLDSSTRPDCARRVNECGEPAGALRDVRPLPVGVEDIRKNVSA